MSKTVPQKQDLESLIHPNTFNNYQIGENARIQKVSPSDLITGARLDVLARYIYARSKLENHKSDWGLHVYKNFFLSITNNFANKAESFDPGRSSMPEYIAQFDELINSIRAKGFDADISVIPTCGNTIIDGAHRLAASLACGIQTIKTVELSGEEQVQDYKVLKRIGMDPDVILHMVYEFTKLKNKTRMAVLFPVAGSVTKKAEEEFENVYNIDYTESFALSFQGLKNLQNFFYGQHEWWTPWQAHNFAKNRTHKIYKNITIILFQETDNQSTRALKEKIRTLHPAENHVMHTTDTHEETILAAEILLNTNGRAFLEKAEHQKTPVFDREFQIFSDLVKKQGLTDKVALDTGSVLALHGLRDIHDIDYISKEERVETNDPLISRHEGEYEALNVETDDILYNPKNHLVYNGLKFVSIDMVARLKKSRTDKKDKIDLALIKNMKNKQALDPAVLIPRLISKLRYRAYVISNSSYDTLVRFLKRILPTGIFKALRSLYRKLIPLK